MAVVKVDEKGRILLSKEIRKKTGVERNDRLIARPLSKGKILLEKTLPKSDKDDPLDWLLRHPGKIKSTRVAKQVREASSTSELIEKWKDELWMGD